VNSRSASAWSMSVMPDHNAALRAARIAGAHLTGLGLEAALGVAGAGKTACGRYQAEPGTWSSKRYLNIGLLKDQQMRGAITA
jgi:hypothetical protein